MDEGKKFLAPPLESAPTNGRWRWLRRLFNGAAPEPEPLQQYVRLAVQLALERPAGEKAKSILLTSPKSEQLIRDTGMDFAYALAHEMGQRVLLIDADFGRADEQGAPGLTDLLVRGSEGLLAAARPTNHDRVFTLPVGSPALMAASLAAGRHPELMDRACANYDSVILLGAPVLNDPKGLMFAPLVDHSLLVAIEGGTYLSDLDASLRVLSECKASGVGVVLTRERRRPPATGGEDSAAAPVV